MMLAEVAAGPSSRFVDVPFVLEDGQVVGRLVYERLTAVPANYTARASDQLSAARTEVVQTFQVSL